MKNVFLMFMLILSLETVVAQSDDGSTVIKENIHLHLNKTTFFQGESLWLTAYVQDQNEKTVSKITKNLHVALSDKDGSVISKKTIYIENGIGIGDFDLDSTFTDTYYNLTAWTNYMRNFKELKPFEQTTTILQETGKEETVDAELPAEFMVYPEGGTLISGAYNQMAIRLTDGNGKGILQDSMSLKDRSGGTVRSAIATDAGGYGRIGFMVDENEEYTLEFEQKYGLPVKKILPLPSNADIGIQLDNHLNDKIVIKLLGSRSLLESKSGEQYTLAIFQDDKLFIQDIDIDENEPVIALERELFSYGVNTVVLLRSNLEPIAHRMFFNYIGQGDRTVSELPMKYTLERDTLRLEVSLPEELDEGSLSISALPYKTVSYGPQNSIATSFLLRPYLSGNTTMPHKYLGEGVTDRKNRFGLDTRLVMEGQGNYSWDSRVMKQVQLEYALESGFTVSGKIADADLTKEKQVYLVTNKTKDMAYGDLQSNKTFTENMDVYQGDSLAVTLIGAKGKLRKAKTEVYFDEVPNVVPGPYLSYTVALDQHVLNTTIERGTDVIGPKVNDRTIVLDEALVTAKSKVEKKILLSPYAEARIIDDEDIKRTPSVVSYFSGLGLRPIYINGQMQFQSLKHPYPISFISINGFPVSPGELDAMPLSRVLSLVVVFNRLEKTHSVNIHLRPGPYIAPEKRNKYVRFLIKNGYAKSRSYEDPGYADYDSDYFGYYGVLDWQPNVRVNGFEPTLVNIPVFGQDCVQLHIEGIASDGSLVHVTETIKLNDSP